MLCRFGPSSGTTPVVALAATKAGAWVGGGVRGAGTGNIFVRDRREVVVLVKTAWKQRPKTHAPPCTDFRLASLGSKATSSPPSSSPSPFVSPHLPSFVSPHSLSFTEPCKPVLDHLRTKLLAHAPVLFPNQHRKTAGVTLVDSSR